MRILLTNDDGYHAPGLAALEAIAAELSDDVWVVAPADEQSGASRSLTINRPLRIRAFGERRFAVSGTPTDAVLMALGTIMKDTPPDLILSGVNRGANLAEDVLYSGTVAAAMEGALAGVRSIALSQLYRREGDGVGGAVSFATAESWGARVLRPLLDLPFDPRTPRQRQLSRLRARRRPRHPYRGAGTARPRAGPRGPADRSARFRLLLARDAARSGRAGRGGPTWKRPPRTISR